MKVLVTGSTGYIGGRLIPKLLDAGHEVRCLARDPSRLALHPWVERVDVVQGDVLRPETLPAALEGCDAAYYLIHSMDGRGEFERRDRTAAANFAAAAERAGVGRIVYLGGLGDPDDRLSKHLSSRHEVGQVLRNGATPVTELRAAIIIGSGSVSFEMLRYLTEVLPVMTTPRWVRTRCQPIAIRDVLGLLVSVLEDPEPVERTLEIGGPDVLTYEEMMQVYAEEAGLPRRAIIPVPVLSPGLSSRWVGLVTPLPVGVARPLIDSLRNEVVVTDDMARELFPYNPLPYRQAVRVALQSVADYDVETRWSDAAHTPAIALPSDPSWSGGTVFEDRRQVTTQASPESLYGAFSRIGGEVGYYTMDWAWELRGFVDQVSGGVGLRRGRRHPTELRPGEALDFWRVAAAEPPHRLVLKAEMRVPGEAFLEFRAEARPGGSALTQVARFRPRGLLGRLYWYALWPFHAVIFGRMAGKIAEAAGHELPQAGERAQA